MKNIEVEIKGIAKMIMNNPNAIVDKATTMTTGKPDWSKEAEDKLYKTSDGKLCFPSTWIEGTLRKSASNFKIPGRGKKTYKDLTLSSLIVEPNEILIKPQKYEVDARTVIIGRSRVMRYRPIFNDWSAKFNIQILDEQFSDEAAKQILEYAGGYVGIGDYRPKFGRFQITTFNSKTE